MGMRVDENGNWRSFRHRNYRILFPANAVSNIGSWAQRIAQDWLVLELTDNNGYYLGLVTAIQFAPFLFFTLHGGLLADRVNKRLALVVTNIFGGLSALSPRIIGDFTEISSYGMSLHARQYLESLAQLMDRLDNLLHQKLLVTQI
jgi:MFS family permease